MAEYDITYPILENPEGEFTQLEKRSFKMQDFEVNKLSWIGTGTQVTLHDLLDLRGEIFDFAKPYRFFLDPCIRDDKKVLFDRSLGKFLYENLNVTPSMAATLSMWQFLNVCLVPELVVWRWGKSKDHFLSARRNFLGTQWWRYYLFKDAENLYFQLPESEMADLYERPGTRGLPEHVVEVASWYKALIVGKYNPPREWFREVLKRYNTELGYRLYFTLTEDDRKQLFVDCFNAYMAQQGQVKA